MVVSNTSRLVGKKDFIRLAILSAIALVIGTCLIATTVMISMDGVEYIRQAQQFESEPLEVVKKHSPGYPFLIFIAHKCVSFFCSDVSVKTWIYSAQGVTLLCRLLSLIPLYFIGKLLVGGKRSFWSVLILVMLPYPIEFGSDVLRDWPHILFLAWGFLLLLFGAKQSKWWMFGIAGFVSGLGHMVRPECAQLVIYGILWLLVSFFLRRDNMSRLKALCALLFLLIGFAVSAGPYMAAKGKIHLEVLNDFVFSTAPLQSEEIQQINTGNDFCVYTSASLAGETAKAIGRLIEEVCDNLMYFFVPALVIGLYCRLRKIRKVLLTEALFVFALIILYVVLLIKLYIDHGYISRRHCMPLAVFTIFYVPVGLGIIARWAIVKFSRCQLEMHRRRKRLFFILVTIGVAICLVKLERITPMRADKLSYRYVAKWLRENTNKEDTIAVPDRRIAFYAEREGLIYDKTGPKQAKYVVRILKAGEEANGLKKEYSAWADKQKRKILVVYRGLE